MFSDLYPFYLQFIVTSAKDKLKGVSLAFLGSFVCDCELGGGEGGGNWGGIHVSLFKNRGSIINRVLRLNVSCLNKGSCIVLYCVCVLLDGSFQLRVSVLLLIFARSQSEMRTVSLKKLFVTVVIYIPFFIV